MDEKGPFGDPLDGDDEMSGGIKECWTQFLHDGRNNMEIIKYFLESETADKKYIAFLRIEF